MMTDERLEIHVEQNMWHRHGSWGEINCGCKLVNQAKEGSEMRDLLGGGSALRPWVGSG